jgi:hypothetical protein
MRINKVTVITEQKNGFWLYAEDRGMNLAMRAESERAALIQALEYYQRRLLVVEIENKELNDMFVKVSETLGWVDDYVL